MAAIGRGLRESFEANPATAVNSFVRYRAVRLSGERQIDPVTADGQDVVGILEIPPYGPGGAATVCVLGRTKAEAGAAVQPGQYLTVDAEGRVVPASAGSKAFAVALTSAGAAGEMVEILVVHAGAI